jgi:hypothetical protein
MYEVEEGSFKLQVELGGGPPDQVENADGWVTVQGEGTWSATFITLAELNRLMNRWHETGEYLSGRTSSVLIWCSCGILAWRLFRRWSDI